MNVSSSNPTSSTADASADGLPIEVTDSRLHQNSAVSSENRVDTVSKPPTDTNPDSTQADFKKQASTKKQLSSPLTESSSVVANQFAKSNPPHKSDNQSAPPVLFEPGDAPKWDQAETIEMDFASHDEKSRRVSIFKRHDRSFQAIELIPFLASLITHTIAAILLLSFAIVIGRGNADVDSITLTQGKDSEQELNSFEFEQTTISTDLSALDQQRELASNFTGQEPTASSSVSPVGVGEIRVEAASTGPISNGSALETLNDSASTPFFIPTGDVFGGYSVEGRSAGKRQELAMRNGGSAETEAAVEAAIVWLIKHQFKDGSWSTIQDHPDCRGKCRFGSIEDGDKVGRNPKSIAATGLALLTMLGAGYTHREGPYRDEVYRALQFLLSAMQNGEPTSDDPRVTGQFVPGTRHMMYEQGIATFALCEAYQMTGDKWLEPGCQRAINFLRYAQARDGSWGYYPGEFGDLSIVGWQMMALRSAMASGILVPAENIRRVDQFLDSKSLDYSSSYFYRRTREPVPEMTAIGGLMRLMRGWSVTDPRIQKNIQLVVFRGPGLEDDGPESTDVYFNYYATNFLFYAKSGLWPLWNERMKQLYLSTQAKEGHEAGSWFAYREDLDGNGFSGQSDDGLNLIGGRLYTTTMAALTLEVYYRILPIQKDPNQIDFNL